MAKGSAQRLAVLEAPSLDALGLTPGRFWVPAPEEEVLTRRRLLLVPGLASNILVDAIAAEYNKLTSQAVADTEVPYQPVSTLRSGSQSMPDTEIRSRLLDSVSGADVFVCTYLHHPGSGFSVSDKLQDLLFLGRAIKSHGAARVFAVTPKLANDRQDKESELDSANGDQPFGNYREGLGAKITAEQIRIIGLYDGVICLHPHSDAAKGFYEPMLMDSLSPIPVLGSSFSQYTGNASVINVAVDEGAIKFAKRVSGMLNWTTALAFKTRLTPSTVQHGEIIGDFNGKSIAMMFDDIMATGGSIESLVDLLRDNKGLKTFYIAISHPILPTPDAFERLLRLHEKGVQTVYFTDSVPQPRLLQPPFSEFVQIVPLAGYFARMINARYNHQPVTGTRGVQHHS